MAGTIDRAHGSTPDGFESIRLDGEPAQRFPMDLELHSQRLPSLFFHALASIPVFSMGSPGALAAAPGFRVYYDRYRVTRRFSA
jgi:hypothetical protein